MSLPLPLNTPEELALWSGFTQGPATGQESVLNGTFELEQFETALTEARREIYLKTQFKQNEEFTEERLSELKEAERYLAAARLYPCYAAKMRIEFPESNLASVGDVMSGADTPDPYSKAEGLMKAAQQLRAIGLELLNAPSRCWDVSVSQLPPGQRYPWLTAAAYQN